jgi:geranylgeranyl diphosphate synthase type II
MKIYNETVLEICEGQALDKHFEDLDNISIDMYTEMVEKKTGALLGACFYLPAVISGKSNNEIKKIKYIGRQLGIAFQIQDDLFEIFEDENSMGKSLGSDIFSNKKTAIAIEAKNISKTEWDSIIRQFDGKDLENIRNFLLENKVKDKVENLGEHHFKLAYNQLTNLGFNKDSDIYKFFKMIQGRHS